MAKYSTLIDRVLQNVGDPSAGSRREVVLQDFRDLLTVDLPHRLGLQWAQGSVAVSVGGGGAPADGKYTLPPTLRSWNDVCFVDDTPIPISPDPDTFFNEEKYLASGSGSISWVLIYGRELWARPVPSVAKDIVIFGTVWPDYSAITENTEAPAPPIEQVLVASASVLGAVRRADAERITTLNEIMQSRIAAVKAPALASNPPAYKRRFDF